MGVCNQGMPNFLIVNEIFLCHLSNLIEFMLGDTHLLYKNFKPKLLGPFGQDLYAVTLFVNFTNERSPVL